MLGLIIAVVVAAASVTDNVIGVKLLDSVVAHTPTVTKAWVDSGFKDDVAIHGALHGIDVEQVKRSDTAIGFVPVKRRWVVSKHTEAMRAKDICLALGLGTAAKDTETMRAKLKRLVARQILIEAEPGLFSLAPATPPAQPREQDS